MLTVRRPQLDVLAEREEDRFARRVAAALREAHPAAVRGLDEETLLGRVRFGLRRAAGHRLGDGAAPARFVALMFLVGPGFYRHPMVAAVLSQVGMPGDARMDALAIALDEHDWREAAAQSAPEGWERGLRGEVSSLPARG